MDQHSSQHVPGANTESQLLSLYPIVHELVGDAYFHLLSDTYASNYNEDSSPEHFGDRFGLLLLKHYIEHPELDKLAVLPEVARLEWLMHDSEMSKDIYVLNAAQLDTVPVEAQSKICFHACPSIRLMYSRWPLYGIWRAFQRGDMSHLSRDGGEQWLCIYQEHLNQQHKVTVETLNDPTAQLLGGILKGYTLEQLCRLDLDVQRYLPVLVQKHWLDYFTLKEA